MSKKIEITQELMSIFQSHFFKENPQFIPYEYTLCKMLLENNQNKQYIQELRFLSSLNSVSFFAIKQFLPQYFDRHFARIFLDFFEFPMDECSNKKYNLNILNESLFFDIIHRFIGLIDVYSSITKLLQNNKEFSMPIIQYDEEYPTYAVSNFFNPQFPLVHNSLALGKNFNHNFMLLSAPTGAGKTALIKSILFSLYSSGLGFISAEHATLSCFYFIFQNFSYVFNHQRGFSRQMGEDMFIDTIINITKKFGNIFSFLCVDEIYAGTTRDEAKRKFFEYIQKIIEESHMSLGVFSTHEEEIQKIAAQSKNIKNYYIKVNYDPHGAIPFTFTYTLHENPFKQDKDDWWFDKTQLNLRNLYTSWLSKKGILI